MLESEPAVVSGEDAQAVNIQSGSPLQMTKTNFSLQGGNEKYPPAYRRPSKELAFALDDSHCEECAMLNL